MSIFAGIVHRREESSDHSKEKHVALRRALSRASDKLIHAHELPGAFVVTAELPSGSSSCGVIRDPAGITVVAGIPYLGAGLRQDRSKLHAALGSGRAEALRAARGVFCAAYISADGRQIRLVSDKLGVRPIYYWNGPEFLVFATALRILEVLDFVPCEMDLLGSSECVAFGFPLADRTPYRDISCIREAEIISIDSGAIAKQTYFRWDQLQQIEKVDAPSRAMELFRDALSLRCAGQSNQVSFLSGGMDSRSIVACLRSLGTNVSALNFSPPSSQDESFSRLFAEAANCDFINLQIPYDGRTNWSITMSQALQTNAHLFVGANVERLVWAGDGGSVSVGSVYLNQTMIDLMREGEVITAIETFLKDNRIGIPRKLLGVESREVLRLFPITSVERELQRIRCDDPGRALHLFLMFNDQRRHLFGHFESIDVHGVEFHLPFFDSQFLEFVFSLPIDYRLRHTFYQDFFDLLPDSAQSVPWQTYPGHVPCPVPVQTQLSYQWAERSAQTTRNVAQAFTLLFQGRVPSPPISNVGLALAAFLHLLNLRDCSSALRALETYSRIAECGWGGVHGRQA